MTVFKESLFQSKAYVEGGYVLDDVDNCAIVKYSQTFLSIKEMNKYADARRRGRDRPKKGLKNFGTRVRVKGGAQVATFRTFQVIPSQRLMPLLGDGPHFFPSRKKAVAFVKNAVVACG